MRVPGRAHRFVRSVLGRSALIEQQERIGLLHGQLARERAPDFKARALHLMVRRHDAPNGARNSVAAHRLEARKNEGVVNGYGRHDALLSTLHNRTKVAAPRAGGALSRSAVSLAREPTRRWLAPSPSVRRSRRLGCTRWRCTSSFHCCPRCTACSTSYSRSERTGRRGLGRSTRAWLSATRLLRAPAQRRPVRTTTTPGTRPNCRPCRRQPDRTVARCRADCDPR